MTLVTEWTKAPANSVFIGGSWVTAPSNVASLKVLNPATEQQIATVPNCDSHLVNLAVAAARQAFDSGPWGKTTGAQRAEVLQAIADLVEKNKDRLAKLEAADCGKPFKESAWDMDDVAGCFRYYAKSAVELDSRQDKPVALPLDTFTTTLRYEPCGVAAAIIPWNYPLLMASWKVAPALAAGCTVVLKPSELTPLTALELANLAKEAGLPDGVLNVITGDGTAGTPLTLHPDVDKIAFTGSVTTGARVMMSAAQGIKGLTLELGGKSPFIIFEDVDIEKAVEWAMFGCFWTNGQICSATSRLLVHEKIAEKLLERLVKETQKIHIGDPLAPENMERTGMLGPLVSRNQLDKVMGYIELGKKEGGKVLTGGKRPTQFAHGYYLEPTIFQATPSMTIWREEIFGPVLSVVSFKTEAEAVQLANETDYGLAAAVMSADEARCKRIVRAMRSGIVWVNCSQPCFVETSWGGVKKSGFGRELGPFGLDNYLQVKQVTTYTSSQPWGWYIKQ